MRRTATLMDHPLGMPWTTHVKKTPQSDFDRFKEEISSELRGLKAQCKADAEKHERTLSEVLEQILKSVHNAKATTQELTVRQESTQKSLKLLTERQESTPKGLKLLQEECDGLWRFIEKRLVTLEDKAGIEYITPPTTPRGVTRI